MKRALLILQLLWLCGCGVADGVDVTVTNPSSYARTLESVEIAWTELEKRGITAEQVIVEDEQHNQIPSQVIFDKGGVAQRLLFQASVEASGKSQYKIKRGVADTYEAKVYGRYVPERLDDYAWENNLCAYRLYGPALETSPEKLITPGIDVWVKCTEKLVIDEWYAKGDYHHNYGEGMDCYKVGKTLGGGASVPMVEGKFWPMEHNYASCKTLDNGPIRTSVELNYVAWDVNGTPVSLVKTITLDANQRFNRMENIYTGAFEELPIAAGFVRHDVKGTESGKDWLAMVEAVSDSKQPEVDGDIYQAIVLPGAEFNADLLGHSLAIKPVKSGEKMTYYSASGWSQGGVENMEEWVETIKEQVAMVESPLEVTMK